jgi:hypothetical protein
MANSMLEQNDSSEPLVVRDDRRWVTWFAGAMLIIFGIIMLFIRLEVFTFVLAAIFIICGLVVLLRVPATKVWTFDRAAGTVRYERQAVLGSSQVFTHDLSNIVEIRLTPPTSGWMSLLYMLTTTPEPEPNLFVKIREGERIKQYIVTTTMDRKKLDQQMKEIKEFVGQGKQKNVEAG